MFEVISVKRWQFRSITIPKKGKRPKARVQSKWKYCDMQFFQSATSLFQKSWIQHSPSSSFQLLVTFRNSSRHPLPPIFYSLEFSNETRVLHFQVHQIMPEGFCLFKGRIAPLPDESNPYLQCQRVLQHPKNLSMHSRLAPPSFKLLRHAL